MQIVILALYQATSLCC